MYTVIIAERKGKRLGEGSGERHEASSRSIAVRSRANYRDIESARQLPPDRSPASSYSPLSSNRRNYNGRNADLAATGLALPSVPTSPHVDEFSIRIGGAMEGNRFSFSAECTALGINSRLTFAPPRNVPLRSRGDEGRSGTREGG